MAAAAIYTSFTAPPAPNPQNLESFLQPLIIQFADVVGYAPESETGGRPLWEAMCQYANQTGVPHDVGTHSYNCFVVGYKYSVVCFPHHPLAVRVYAGILTWLAAIMDGETPKFLEEFQMFHKRFFAGEEQRLLLLQAWANLMKLTFSYWNPVVANFIVTSSLNFLNANLLEARDGLGSNFRTRGGHSSAWFLREKDRASEAYAWFTFPMAVCSDVDLFMEVIPDLTTWIWKTNDILSFYKEEKAGETGNYIHNRAFYAEKHPFCVFEDVVSEGQTMVDQMRLVLENKESCLQALSAHLSGYVAFHRITSRYRLSEVGLGEQGTDRSGSPEL